MNQSPKFVSFQKGDPKIQEYLWGQFSKTERALIQPTLNNETSIFTFEIQNKTQIKPPNIFQILHFVLKINSLPMILLPCLIIYIFKNPKPELGLLSLNFAVVVFLFLAMQMRGSVVDHINGLDRTHPRSTHPALANGWMTAREQANWSWAFLFLAATCAIPVLIQSPMLLGTFGIVSGLSLFFLWRLDGKFKHQIFGEWIVFLFFGPFLIIGFSLGVGATISAYTILLSIIFGIMAVYYHHIKNYRNLVTNGRSHFINSISFLGFEKSKFYLITWLVSMSAFEFLILYIYHGSAWAIGVLIVAFFYIYKSWKTLKSLTSPLSSQLVRLDKLIKTYILILMWFLFLATVSVPFTQG